LGCVLLFCAEELSRYFISKTKFMGAAIEYPELVIIKKALPPLAVRYVFAHNTDDTMTSRETFVLISMAGPPLFTG